jgi:hypothetical protein
MMRDAFSQRGVGGAQVRDGGVQFVDEDARILGNFFVLKGSSSSINRLIGPEPPTATRVAAAGCNALEQAGQSRRSHRCARKLAMILSGRRIARTPLSATPEHIRLKSAAVKRHCAGKFSLDLLSKIRS